MYEYINTITFELYVNSVYVEPKMNMNVDVYMIITISNSIRAVV